jgi:hypothetical protein
MHDTVRQSIIKAGGFDGMRFRLHFVVLFAAAAVAILSIAMRAADTLPAQLSDDAFWKFIDTSSESGGVFQSENFLSNETGFQAVIPALQQIAKPGGVYMGVGPEQNFTYIAGIRPKIAFIIDIRRQNMIEHMIYKAVFEMSPDRADFVSRMFSLKRPAGLTDKSTVSELFNAYDAAEPIGNEAFEKNLQDIKDLLVKKHKFGLTSEDLADLTHVYTVFRTFGPEIDYNSGSFRGGRGRRGGMPNYLELMEATDLKGQHRSYLANEENYRFLRELETKNLIVPLTGDFGGPKAIRAVGRYLKDHGATVTAFYLSNVEQYLFQGNGNQNGGWTNFYDNVGTLPLDESSTFIRSAGGGVRGFGGGGGGMRAPNVLASMQDTVTAAKAGQIQTYYDVFTLSR